MPELPEVETIVRDLRKKILGRKVEDIWTDFEKMVKKPKNFNVFKKELKGKKVKSVRRRGKNILIDLSDNKILLIHQKLTGHLLFGKWQKIKGKWRAVINGPLKDDPMNKFLHLIFWLDNGKMLALSDLRKFAKIELWDSQELKESEDFKGLGPEPLKSNFTFNKFKEILNNKRGEIKQVLMDQKAIAGIGNIYSDEILWEAKINPLKDVLKLSDKELGKIYRAIRKILALAIKLKGESISDFRTLAGEKGGYDKFRRIYRKEGKRCVRCGTIVKKTKLGGRSAHFCPKCQPI